MTTTTTIESNAAGVQGALPSECLGLVPASAPAPVSTCTGCSEEKALIMCGICCTLTCRKCCAGCNSRRDNKS